MLSIFSNCQQTQIIHLNYNQEQVIKTSTKKIIDFPFLQRQPWIKYSIFLSYYIRIFILSFNLNRFLLNQNSKPPTKYPIFTLSPIQPQKKYSKTQHRFQNPQKIIIIKNFEMKQLLLQLLTLLLYIHPIKSTNYISNGSFQQQSIGAFGGQWILEGALGWNGSQYVISILYSTLGYGQYVDLQYVTGINGYIQQNVILPQDGRYNLSFYQMAHSTTYSYYVMEVYWNGQLISTQYSNTTSVTFQVFVVEGVQGNNVLKFNQIGDPADSTGMFIDEVSLTYIGPIPTNNTNSSQALSPKVSSYVQNFNILPIKYTAAVIFSSVLNHAPGVRYAYFFTEDLWLYNYDKVAYEGTLLMVFNTTTEIQTMKQNFFETIFVSSTISQYLPGSEYRVYSNKRFIEIENESWVLIRTALPFFLIVVPLNIVACLVLYFLFYLVKNYKVSKYLRKFYFIKTALLQILLEGNIVYFTYVCFGHLTTSFTFEFGDKISLFFTVLFLFLLVIFTFGFYPLMGSFLLKKSSYFLYSCYRCYPGYTYLSVKNLIRNFLRGTVFYFLHQNYTSELILLSIIEVFLSALSIYLQSIKKVFLNKVFYCLWLIYHFLFILFNFTLYFGYLCDTVYKDAGLKQLALKSQEFVIYALTTDIVFIFGFDLLPEDWLRSRKIVQVASQADFRSSHQFHEYLQNKKFQKNTITQPPKTYLQNNKIKQIQPQSQSQQQKHPHPHKIQNKNIKNLKQPQQKSPEKLNSNSKSVKRPNKPQKSKQKNQLSNSKSKSRALITVKVETFIKLKQKWMGQSPIVH